MSNFTELPLYLSIQDPQFYENPFPNLAPTYSFIISPLSVQIQHVKPHSLCYELLFADHSYLASSLLVCTAAALFCMWQIVYLREMSRPKTFGFGQSTRYTWLQEHSRPTILPLSCAKIQSKSKKMLVLQSSLRVCPNDLIISHKNLTSQGFYNAQGVPLQGTNQQQIKL